MAELSNTKRDWRVVADFPNGSDFSEGHPYICVVPWDKRRKRWKTERSMVIFDRSEWEALPDN